MTRHNGASLIGLLGGGLVLGVLCLAAGQLVLGMGHGWELPRLYGLFSLILYPLAMMRWGWIGGDTRWGRDAGVTALIAVPTLVILAAWRILPYPTGIPAAGWIVLGLAALYWLIGHLLQRNRQQARWGDAVLLAIGVAMDIAAIAEFSGSGIAQRSGLLLAPWVVLWLGWQAAAVLAMLRHTRAKAALS